MLLLAMFTCSTLLKSCGMVGGNHRLCLHLLCSINLLVTNKWIFFDCRLSACCVHVSALLHALVALKPSNGFLLSDENDEESVPVTSQPCERRQPRIINVSICIAICTVLAC